METPEWRPWLRFGVFIVNFEHISPLVELDILGRFQFRSWIYSQVVPCMYSFRLFRRKKGNWSPYYEMIGANSVYSWQLILHIFFRAAIFKNKGILSDCQWLSLLLLITVTTKLQIIFLSRDLWLNSWVFVYKLSDCGFESCCYHLRPISVSAGLAITVVKKSG